MLYIDTAGNRTPDHRDGDAMKTGVEAPASKKLTYRYRPYNIENPLEDLSLCGSAAISHFHNTSALLSLGSGQCMYYCLVVYAVPKITPTGPDQK